MLSNDFVNNEYDLLVQWREAIIFLEIGELDSILSTWSYYFLAHMVLLSRILSWYFKKTSLESIKTHHDSVVHLYKVYFKGKKIEIEIYMFWPHPLHRTCMCQSTWLLHLPWTTDTQGCYLYSAFRWHLIYVWALALVLLFGLEKGKWNINTLTLTLRSSIKPHQVHKRSF